MADFEKTIKINPRWALAHWNRGRALRAQGRTAEAERAIEAAISLDPTVKTSATGQRGRPAPPAVRTQIPAVPTWDLDSED